MGSANEPVPHKGEVGDGLDIPALVVWLDNYCQAHPLDWIMNAANEFYNSVSDSSAP